MSQQNRIDSLKKEFPIVLRNCLGIVSTACDRLKVSRSWYYEMRKSDLEFRQTCDDVNEVVVDYVEGKLLELIEDKNPAAIIFYAKTKGKHRGYVERIETTGKDGSPIENNIKLCGPAEEAFDRAMERYGAKKIAEYVAMKDDGKNAIQSQ